MNGSKKRRDEWLSALGEKEILSGSKVPGRIRKYKGEFEFALENPNLKVYFLQVLTENIVFLRKKPLQIAI
jgi:hypothetical protein